VGEDLRCRPERRGARLRPPLRPRGACQPAPARRPAGAGSARRAAAPRLSSCPRVPRRHPRPDEREHHARAAERHASGTRPNVALARRQPLGRAVTSSRFALALPAMRGVLHPRPCRPSSPSRRGRSRHAGRASGAELATILNGLLLPSGFPAHQVVLHLSGTCGRKVPRSHEVSEGGANTFVLARGGRVASTPGRGQAPTAKSPRHPARCETGLPARRTGEGAPLSARRCSREELESSSESTSREMKTFQAPCRAARTRAVNSAGRRSRLLMASVSNWSSTGQSSHVQGP